MCPKEFTGNSKKQRYIRHVGAVHRKVMDFVSPDNFDFIFDSEDKISPKKETKQEFKPQIMAEEIALEDLNVEENDNIRLHRTSILRQRKRPNLQSTKDKSGIEDDPDEIDDIMETSADVHGNPDQFSSESESSMDDSTLPLTKSPRKDKIKREITYDATQKRRKRMSSSASNFDGPLAKVGSKSKFEIQKELVW